MQARLLKTDEEVERSKAMDRHPAGKKRHKKVRYVATSFDALLSPVVGSAMLAQVGENRTRLFVSFTVPTNELDAVLTDDDELRLSVVTPQ